MMHHRLNKEPMMGRPVVRIRRIRLASVCQPMMTVMIFFKIINGIMGETRLYQGRRLMMLTGQLETGTITVSNVPKMKTKLKAIDRAKTKLTTTGAGIEIDSLGVDYAKCDGNSGHKADTGRSVRHGQTFSNEGVNDNRGSIRVGNKFV